jgi:tripartite-type tricarboxylate transporter receptor subunit TctC
LAAFAAAGATIVVGTDYAAHAQIARSIRIVVPYAPGGTADIVARLMADQAGRTGRSTMIVENRPGAGGAVGTETVARATADGTTLLVVSTPFLIDPLLRKLNYDPLRSFAPICNLVSSPTLIVVNSASPYRTLGQLLDECPSKTGADHDGQYRSGIELSARFRNAQARSESGYDFRALSGQRAGAQRRLRSAGHFDVRNAS